MIKTIGLGSFTGFSAGLMFAHYLEDHAAKVMVPGGGAIIGAFAAAALTILLRNKNEFYSSEKQWDFKYLAGTAAAWLCYGLISAEERNKPVIVGGIMLLTVVSNAATDIYREMCA